MTQIINLIVIDLSIPFVSFSPQLQRSPDQQEAQEQLSRADELEELQEEAHAAHHRGDYVRTVQVLDRVIEVWDMHAVNKW